jgi:pimeloyl-ACP methyl ester carboxylesterase/predicted glycosyltransferase
VGVTIDRVGRSDTETPARLPDESGFIERDGVRMFWESYGTGERAVLLLPTWSVIHSRHWKAQIPYLARHFRVITFDGRGNGLSDRPTSASAYHEREFIADAVAVLDATGVESACVAGLSMGGLRALVLAAEQPDRVSGACSIAPSVPVPLVPDPPGWWAGFDFEAEREHYEGWEKYNRHYWRSDYRGFLKFFFSECLCEPHSTKQIEDLIAWGLDGDPEMLVRTFDGRVMSAPDVPGFEMLLRSIQCPVLVLHGTEDRVIPIGRSERIAELTGGELVVLEGSGHIATARDPVVVNRLLGEFASRVIPAPDRGVRTWVRARVRPKRALFISSPIGLGHAWRDARIADELRLARPGLEITWLAQEPVTTVLAQRGETISPASAELASEVRHIDREAGGHELHVFEALRRMDEILCANFMVFADLVREQAFDVWIGDEAWELDHFLHENPELKTAPYVWMTDFVGYLPMPEYGEHEAFLTSDYNAEMIEHVERHPAIRDRAIFIGEPDDVIPRGFGPDLPEIRAWTESHYEFAGYVPSFDPATLGDRADLREALGYGSDPVCLVSVGGSGVGAWMLRRVIEALSLARERVPGLRMIAVTGPRIDPCELPRVDGLELRGYVHELYRELAACDVAVVQGGLSTTMELVTAGRPFIALPLVGHFEQRYHVRHRLDRHGARKWLELGETTPEEIAGAIADALGEEPSYVAVDPGGAARAAASIAELL